MSKSNIRPWVKLFLEVSILKILQEKPTYGNYISDEIKRRTFEVASPNPNTLYPLLREMEEAGYLSSQWASPDKRNRRIYHITEQGLAYFPILEQKAKDYFIQMEKNIGVLRECLFEKGEFL